MPEVRYATVQFPGVRYPLGDITLTALVPKADGTIALQDRGAGTPTFTRSSTALVRQWDNSYVSVATNEPRFEGARRVSEGVWSWQKSDGAPLHPTRTLKWTNPDTNITGTVATVFAFYAQRANSTAYALGDKVWADEGGTRYWYECTTAGTSDSSQPTMPTTAGTVADGTATWTFGGLYTFRGLLLEPAKTNLFLNSDAPATQTITITATGNYTVSVIGSGSATSSDNTATSTGHGAASDGTPVTFNVSATGTVDITISGTPTYVQVEAGTVPSSPIVTAGSATTRATEVQAGVWHDSNIDRTKGTALLSVMLPVNANQQGSNMNAFVLGDGLSINNGGAANARIDAAATDGGSGIIDGLGNGFPVAGNAQRCATRWGGTDYSVLARVGSAAESAVTGAFDGELGTQLIGRFDAPASGLYFSNVLLFKRDLGVDWIEENA